jgi:hypothetical protein
MIQVLATIVAVYLVTGVLYALFILKFGWKSLGRKRRDGTRYVTTDDVTLIILLWPLWLAYVLFSVLAVVLTWLTRRTVERKDKS